MNDRELAEQLESICAHKSAGDPVQLSVITCYAIIAALRRSQPEGMVTVPREPSEQMISDGEMRYLEIWYPNESNFVSNPKWRRVVREMFKAMLSAAEAEGRKG